MVRIEGEFIKKCYLQIYFSAFKSEMKPLSLSLSLSLKAWDFLVAFFFLFHRVPLQSTLFAISLLWKGVLHNRAFVFLILFVPILILFETIANSSFFIYL